MNRRRSLIYAAACSFATGVMTSPVKAQTRAPARSLPWPADLRQAALAAQARGEPLVLMASLPGCPWCELLRRNYLGPMRQDGVAAFEFMLNERHQKFKAFDGQSVSPSNWSDNLKIQIAPTLLFLDPKGQELVARIEGVASADMIGDLLDDRLSRARQRIKAQR
jgi:thioredoxin-related protein